MTEKEIKLKEKLVSYIIHNVLSIKKNMKVYNEFLTGKLESYDKILVENNIPELKECVNDIKNISEYVEWVNSKRIMIESMPGGLNKNPRRGEIWTCELGKNIGSEESKVKLVVIIQNNTGNVKAPTTIIAPISNRPCKIAVHIKLRESDYKLTEGEAETVTGTILCEQIRTVSKARLGRHIATLEKDVVDNILNVKLRKAIGL